MWVHSISKLFLFLLGTTLHYTEARHHHDNEGQDKYNIQQQPASFEDMSNGLSPWELHVVNDLLMEVMLLKCQNVNRTVARGLKTFITSQVSKAPRVETMNSHFFPVYSNLVKCMDDIDAQRDEKVVQEEKPKEIAGETTVTDLGDFSTFDITESVEETTDSTEDEDVVPIPEKIPSSAPIGIVVEEEEEEVQFHESPKEHLIEHPDDLVHQQILIIGLTFDNSKGKNEDEKKDKDTSDDDTDDNEIEPEVAPQSGITKKVEEDPKSADDSIMTSASDLISKIWGRTANWFSSWGRKKRSLGNANVFDHKKRHDKKEENLQSLATKQVMHNYKEVLKTLERLAHKSCPSKHRPNHAFITKAIKEIIYWVGKDFPAAMNAYEKYFLQGYMGLQVHLCLANESFQ